jgi:hypothetical protein
MWVWVVSFECLRSGFVFFFCKHYVLSNFTCGFDASHSFYFTKLCFVKHCNCQAMSKELFFLVKN